VLNEATKGKCRQAQNQEDRIKFWLKAQIAKKQSKDTQCKETDCATLDSNPGEEKLLTTGGSDCPTLNEKQLDKTMTVTETERMRTHVELQQSAGTHGLNWYRPRVCVKSKTKLNTDNPDLEEASGIDN
jgi:hypothetical protein